MYSQAPLFLSNKELVFDLPGSIQLLPEIDGIIALIILGSYYCNTGIYIVWAYCLAIQYLNCGFKAFRSQLRVRVLGAIVHKKVTVFDKFKDCIGILSKSNADYVISSFLEIAFPHQLL